MASMGGRWPSLAAWRMPPDFPGHADPSPNPTSPPPRRNPQYALQQPKSSQTLSAAQRSRRISLPSRPVSPTNRWGSSRIHPQPLPSMLFHPFRLQFHE